MEVNVNKQIGKKQFKMDVSNIEAIHNFGCFSDKFNGDIIYLDSQTFNDVSVIGNTTLEELEQTDLFDFVLEKCNTFVFKCVDYDNNRPIVNVIQIRKAQKNDFKRFRNKIRFFPNNTYIYKLFEFQQDGSAEYVEMPFIQNRKTLIRNVQDKQVYDDSIIFLEFDSRFSKINTKLNQNLSNVWKGHGKNLQIIIERVCDLASTYFVRYKIDSIRYHIPIDKKSLPKTFRSREIYGARRKKIIHEVHNFTRINGAEVKAHLRGNGDAFVMDGKEYDIVCGPSVYDFCGFKSIVNMVKQGV